MTNDYVSDLLTRIRNAQRAGHKSVVVLDSKMTRQILAVLKNEGMIESFADSEKKQGFGKLINVALRYTSTGRPVITKITTVSKPGRRIYQKADNLPKVSCGLGVAVISTSRGVMSDKEARKNSVGGEILALVG